MAREYHPEEWIPVVGAFLRIRRFNELCRNALEESATNKDISCYEYLLRQASCSMSVKNKHKEFFTNPFMYYHALSLCSPIPYFVIKSLS